MTGDDFYEAERMANRAVDRATKPLLEMISRLEERVSKLEEEREAHDRQHACSEYVHQMEGF